MVLKNYAEFLTPDIFVSNSSYKEITEDEYKHPEKIKLSDYSFAFRTVQREEAESGSEILKGIFKNESGWHYRGVVKTREDVLREDGEKSILYRNMINNNYDRVVKTKFGQAFPLYEKDTVVL